MGMLRPVRRPDAPAYLDQMARRHSSDERASASTAGEDRNGRLRSSGDTTLLKILELERERGYGDDAVYPAKVFERVDVLKISRVDDKIAFREFFEKLFGQLRRLTGNVRVGNDTYSRLERYVSGLTRHTAYPSSVARFIHTDASKTD